MPESLKCLDCNKQMKATFKISYKQRHKEAITIQLTIIKAAIEFNSCHIIS